KTSIFSHSVYLFLREFSLQDSRGGSLFQYAADIHCILAVAFFPFKRQLRRFCLISDEPLVVSMSL
ncbi:hypothetical protein PO631_26450, partial [Escherichia coli]